MVKNTPGPHFTFEPYSHSSPAAKENEQHAHFIMTSYNTLPWRTLALVSGDPVLLG